MSDQITFPAWLAQTILRGCLNLQETRFTFGKHNGKDHTDRSIPAPYIQWALENINNNRLIPPAFRRELEQELENRRSRGGRANRPAAPAVPNAPAAPTDVVRRWFFAKIIRDGGEMKTDQYIALAKRDDGRSDFVVLSGQSNGVKNGIFSKEEVTQLVQAVKNGDEYITANSPEGLKDKVPDYQQQAAPQKAQTLNREDMSEEQKKIDERFERMMSESNASHMMINALAGTGKTTMLKHLAWKYGKPGQKWLYLVFNTKNRVEAEESFPREWVEVKTTNAFLGDLLKEQPNLAKIGQTDRINQRLQGGEGNGKLDKSRIMADGSGFAKVMKSVGLVDKLDCPHCHGALAKKKSGRYNITYCNACRSEMYERTGVSLMSLLKSITYNFKEATLTVVGLAKAYALDPRKPDKLKEGLEALLDDYDTIDTSLSEIKERINKYSGYFKDDIVHDLAQILGYNFMAKDFKEEIKTAATWMMNKTMPGGTDEKYKHRERDYNLGEMRDFVDDAWFPAIHADEIHWPKYDIVMADEVQDFNEARKIMLKKLAEAGAKVIAVGDPNQAIYRFIGADADAFNNLAKMLTDVSHDKDNVVHSISKNFRSRPKILEFSEGETHVKDLKSGKKWKEGEEGTVTNQEIAYDDAFGTIKQDNASGALKQKDTKGEFKQTAFIARTNEPLVHAALRLLGNGIPFIILGKDVTGDLLKHLKKVMAKFGITDDHDCSDLESRMNEFLDDQTEMFGNHATKRGYLQDLKESTEAILTTIQTCANEKGARTSIGQYKQWLQDRLGKHSFEVQDNEKDLKEYRKQMEEENPIVLTTAHKSKGLEFSRVYILRYDLFPHKKAKRPKDLAQEANMKYVAITRAKDELHILELDGQPGYKPTKSEE